MERANQTSVRSEISADYVYHSQSDSNRKPSKEHEKVHPLLDAMNITIDKHGTLMALLKASKRVWGKDRDFIRALIGQIGTNGGKL